MQKGCLCENKAKFRKLPKIKHVKETLGNLYNITFLALSSWCWRPQPGSPHSPWWARSPCALPLWSSLWLLKKLLLCGCIWGELPYNTQQWVSFWWLRPWRRRARSSRTWFSWSSTCSTYTACSLHGLFGHYFGVPARNSRQTAITLNNSHFYWL